MNFYPYYVDPLYLAAENEKKSLRSAANRTALAFLLMAGVMVFWSYPVLALFSSFALEEYFYDFVRDTTLVNVIQVTVSSVAFVFPYLLLAKMLKLNISACLRIKKTKSKKQTFALVLLGLGVCGFSNVLLTLAGSLLEQLGFSYHATIDSPNPHNVFGFLLSIIATAVTPAIVEEFAMRGVVLSGLRRFGDGFAVFFSALLFGLMHGNFEQIPFAFILGLYFGFVVIKTDSILPAVLLHFLNNLLSVVLGYASEYMNKTSAVILYPTYFLLLFGLGFAGLALLRKEDPEFYKLSKGESVLTQKRKMLTFAFSPVMILVYVAVLLESFFVYA